MSADRKSSSEALATPVQFLKGVGPDRAELLHKLGLRTARDVLFYFPRDYETTAATRSIDDLEENQAASVCGIVEEIDQRDTARGGSILGVLIQDENQFLRAIWFNQPYLRSQFRRGQRVLLSGKARCNGPRWEMAHPRIQHLQEAEETSTGILPVYPLTEGIKQSHLRRITRYAVEQFAEHLIEVFPDETLRRLELWPIHTALPQIHHPEDQQKLQEARRRFVFQELLVMQLALAIKKYRLTAGRQAISLPVTAKIDARVRRLFPFEFTACQNGAIRDIASDIERTVPMNRLLQGDVGSGKTAVAAYAMLIAVAHGCQTAMMAPTEVLARQHYATLCAALQTSQVRLSLLTGTLTAGERESALTAIESGEVDLIVGTQAILSDAVKFARLGLVIIDEQHRFGVRQRATLRHAGIDPHYLVMTATPIPRTVSMTLFGDLDVSVLDAAPPGRQSVHSYLGTEAKREKWWDFYRKKLREGRQGFVVAPLVGDAGRDDLTSVEQMFEALCNGELADFRVDLIHGRLSATEKQAAMDKFRSGETQVLVATSVVEVGIDVGNANLMTIENGERFGLAQLHQLRGRVSRGSYPGYVCVFANTENKEATDRIDAFINSNDGFELAETDFQLRGPGELLGTKQHGLPPLRIANLQRDTKLLQEARAVASSMIQNDPELDDPHYANLKRMVLVRYGESLELGDVG